MATALLGAGKMGEALARGILGAGLLSPAELRLSDVITAQAQALAAELGAVAAPNNTAAVTGADLVILAVKPQIIAPVCREIAPTLAPGAIILSLAAGVTLRTVREALGRDDLLLARTMPNTPCLVGAGAFGLAFPAGTPEPARARVTRLLAATGLVEELPESMLDAVTGLSGSGTAYIAVLIEALADGGVQAGLPRAAAQRLAAQTVFGAAKLVMESGQHPAQVKDAVASPGGTTMAGLAALEAHGFRNALISAVRAASARSRELSGE